MVPAISASDSDVTAVIVTYNSRDHVLDAVRSLAREHQALDIEVVVVDNGSSDDTADLADGHGGCTVVRTDNRGYAAGVNRGVLESKGTGPVLVLNPDTECLPGAVVAMMGASERHHALIAPRLVDGEGSTSPSIRRTPTIRRAMSLSFTGLPSFTERVEVSRLYETAGPIDWATGAAILVPRECHLALGGWDETFFMYSEETDFCLRAADRGWPVWYEPSAVVRHTGQGSGFNPDLYAMQILNRVRLIRRRRGRGAGSVYYGLAVVREFGRGAAGDRDSRRAVSALLRPSRRPTQLGRETHLVPR